MPQPYYPMLQPSTPFRVRVMTLSRAKARARPSAYARVTVRLVISGRVRIRTKVQGMALVSHIHAAVLPQSYHRHLNVAFGLGSDCA